MYNIICKMTKFTWLCHSQVQSMYTVCHMPCQHSQHESASGVPLVTCLLTLRSRKTASNTHQNEYCLPNLYENITKHNCNSLWPFPYDRCTESLRLEHAWICALYKFLNNNNNNNNNPPYAWTWNSHSASYFIVLTVVKQWMLQWWR